MNKNILIVAVLVGIVGIGGGYYFGYDHGWEGSLKDHESQEMMEDDHVEENGMMDEGMMERTGEDMEEHMDEMMADVREFKVVGTPFKFDVGEIRVKEGDTVRIVFTNSQGTHDLVIDEFNARTKITQTGEADTIEFVANKKGTFEYYCSVGNHRAMGMLGKLIVE